jgi:hypothetical protein
VAGDSGLAGDAQVLLHQLDPNHVESRDELMQKYLIISGKA